MRPPVHPSPLPFGSNFNAIRLAIEYVSPGPLQVSRRKLRKHGKAQLRELAAGISRTGFNVPIIVDERLSVVSGHARLAAAEMLKLDSVPVIRLAHLTEEQLRFFAMFDNRIAERAEWDEAALVLEFEELRLEQPDLDLTDSGFAIAEIDTLVGVSRTAALSDFDDVSGPDGPGITRLGDIWPSRGHASR